MDENRTESESENAPMEECRVFLGISQSTAALGGLGFLIFARSEEVAEVVRGFLRWRREPLALGEGGCGWG